MIDKNLVRLRFSQACSSYDHNAFAQQRINHTLITLLKQYAGDQFNQVFEIGCGTGLLTQMMYKNLTINHWILNDLCSMQAYIKTKLPSIDFTFIEGDIEHIPFPPHNQLIASASTVQWLNQPQHFLKKCAQHLQTNGYLLIGTFTQNNLKEIKTLTHIGLNYPDISDWRTWLEEDFQLLLCQHEDWILPFESPLHILQHLKFTGVSGIQKNLWTGTKLRQFIADYQYHFRLSSGEVSLSYSPLFLLARKK
ncbi:malonyl-ACP O-methyltransferase BioC [Pelistega sp. MC2]|nr:malonyl-ACP O-methyltransferase BioC [Pelistega sp. MC2]